MTHLATFATVSIGLLSIVAARQGVFGHHKININIARKCCAVMSCRFSHSPFIDYGEVTIQCDKHPHVTYAEWSIKPLCEVKISNLAIITRNQQKIDC